VHGRQARPDTALRYPAVIVDPAPQRPRLAIIQTGGTIGSRPDERGDLRPDKRLLTDRISDLSMFETEVHQPFTLPSPHITPAHMHRLRDVIHEVSPRVQGIVITHGTDTLEETAFYLHLTVQTDKPVILTGSMRHSKEPSWDGPFNVWAASHVAMHPFSAGRGALVVFGGDIFDARTVTKIHTTALEAFGGYPGPIGRIDSLDGQPSLRYFARPEQRYPLDPPDASPVVEILTAYAGWRGEGLAEALERSDGVVIGALGAGNLPPHLVPIISRTTKPVILATRTDIGPILPIYGYEGGGKTLYAAGAIPASFLNAFKARIKLIVLLALGYDREGVAAAFMAERSAVAP
jgi:L-asparaginase